MRHDLDPDFRKQPKTEVYCCKCGRDLSGPGPHPQVYLGEGCYEAIDADEPDFDGLRGYLGPECVKSVPEELILKTN